MTDISAIRAREQAATAGPWNSFNDGRYEDHDEAYVDLPYDSIEISRYEDADFIAHARTDIPALLAEIAALTARAEQAEAALRDAEQSENQQPLTLDELGKRECPVWTPLPDGTGFWCLCHQGYITPPSGFSFMAEERPRWVFYDCPPKKDMDKRWEVQKGWKLR